MYVWKRALYGASHGGQASSTSTRGGGSCHALTGTHTKKNYLRRKNFMCFLGCLGGADTDGLGPRVKIEKMRKLFTFDIISLEHCTGTKAFCNFCKISVTSVTCKPSVSLTGI